MHKYIYIGANKNNLCSFEEPLLPRDRINAMIFCRSVRNVGSNIQIVANGAQILYKLKRANFLSEPIERLSTHEEIGFG